MSEPVNIRMIRVRGRAVKATLPNGTVVYRPPEDILNIPDANSQGGIRRVKGAEYYTHFVYVDPKPALHQPYLMCTCGSHAVIAGYNAYKQDAAASTGGLRDGEMVLCYAHATSSMHDGKGVHADGAKE